MESEEGPCAAASLEVRPKAQEGFDTMNEVPAVEQNPNRIKTAQLRKETTTGQVLDSQLAMAARLTKFKYSKFKAAWTRTPRAKCQRDTGKHQLIVN